MCGFFKKNSHFKDKPNFGRIFLFILPKKWIGSKKWQVAGELTTPWDPKSNTRSLRDLFGKFSDLSNSKLFNFNRTHCSARTICITSQPFLFAANNTLVLAGSPNLKWSAMALLWPSVRATSGYDVGSLSSALFSLKLYKLASYWL